MHSCSLYFDLSQVIFLETFCSALFHDSQTAPNILYCHHWLHKGKAGPAGDGSLNRV